MTTDTPPRPHPDPVIEMGRTLGRVAHLLPGGGGAPTNPPGQGNGVSRAARAVWLRDQLAALPPPHIGDTTAERIANRQAYGAALARLGAAIEALPDRPRLRDTGGVCRVAMLGLTASSTGGMVAALRNWIARATT